MNFRSVLDASWPPLRPQLGSQNLSKIGPKLLSSWSSILTWFWHRVFVVSSTHWNIKNWAAVEARIKFCTFDTSYLKLILMLHFGPKSCPKSSPRGSKIQTKTSFETSCQYGCDSEANLAPTWTQLGPKLASQIAPKSLQNPSTQRS